MPRYELSLIFRILERPHVQDAIKRTALAILDRGGIVRSLDNIGPKQLPFRMRNHGDHFTEGHYFLVRFESPITILPELQEQLSRDLDIIRPKIVREEVELSRPCDHQECDFGELTDDIRKKLKNFKGTVKL